MEVFVQKNVIFNNLREKFVAIFIVIFLIFPVNNGHLLNLIAPNDSFSKK